MQFNLKEKVKKAQMAILQQAALSLGILIIVVAVVSLLLSQMLATMTVGSVAYNVTLAGLTALLTFSTWFGIIATVIIGVVIIALLVRAFQARGKGGNA